ncbi:MAG: ATP-dependent Clp protease adaptor ClpS [Bacteroidota bacterium]|nr:ATP-dependent Clp protease adaptor ClpS [Bacteroidota bacterium]MDP4225562.1 ATP-dependent Clp protease adaptor ClpS [Bacteroidota bacterium]MDP4272737.1 ATP-dependent Clp protease adaptor ClpS [Bacteroidota bacterium]
MKNKDNIQEKKFFEDEIVPEPRDLKSLVLHNDDIHTFEYVIHTLVRVCNHNLFQAEQCAYLVHFTGRCDVKKGSLELLRPIKNELINSGLIVSIE